MTLTKYSYQFTNLRISKDGTRSPSVAISTKRILNYFFKCQNNSKHCQTKKTKSKKNKSSMPQHVHQWYVWQQPIKGPNELFPLRSYFLPFGMRTIKHLQKKLSFPSLAYQILTDKVYPDLPHRQPFITNI